MTTGTLTEHQQQAAQRQAVIYRLRKVASRALTYGVMTVLAFVFLFPIVFMVVASFKPSNLVIADLDSVNAFLPNLNSLTLENFSGVFDRVPFEKYAFNSIFLTLMTVSIGLFVNSMAAFVLARMRWIGRALVLGIIISLVIIPLEAIAIPLMMQVNTTPQWISAVLTAVLVMLTVLLWSIMWDASSEMLGSMVPALGAVPAARAVFQALFALLIALPLEIMVYYMLKQTIDGGTWLNTRHVMILPFIAEPFSIFLFYQFFIGVPKDFDEAAYVDGAGFFRIYWQIMVPLSRPVFATIAILKFLQFWSFYLWPLMVVRDQDALPLMVGMDFFQTQAPILWGNIMAYASLVTVPVLIVFLLFQKWFVQSVSSSGVKG